MNAASIAVRAVLTLHCKERPTTGDVLGPYCAECTSPIDGGPELYPCMTVKSVLDAVTNQEDRE